VEVACEKGLDAAVELAERRTSGRVVVLEEAETIPLGCEHALELRDDGIGVVVAPRQRCPTTGKLGEEAAIVIVRAFLARTLDSMPTRPL
jgi:hypothetical protein